MILVLFSSVLVVPKACEKYKSVNYQKQSNKIIKLLGKIDESNNMEVFSKIYTSRSLHDVKRENMVINNINCEYKSPM